MNSLEKHASSSDGRRRRRRSDSVPTPAPARPVSDDPEGEVLQRFIVSGWIVGLSYLPSGLLHAMVGDLVYVRDLALGLHLAVAIGWLIKHRQLGWVAKHSWFIVITPVMLLPAIATHLYVVEGLGTARWSFIWLDWIILGHFVRLDQKWREEYKVLLWVTLFMMGAELAGGIYDWVSGSHLIENTGQEKTVFGVSRMFDETIGGGQMRIRGLQRDVFSFANIMGMNAVAGMAYLLFARKAAHLLGAMAWALAFATMMFLSGGRSAIFGVLAAFFYTVGIFAIPRVTARFERRYVLVWVGIAITLSLVGVGEFTDFVGSTFFGGLYVGDSTSAFMRDDYWTNMLRDFSQHPVILLIGGPAASLFDPRVDPIFHWADNQFLWNAYHLGIVGSVGFAFLFYKVLRVEVRDNTQRKVRQAFILFLVFVIGEGIARESLNYIGCLPLFVLWGYASADEMLALRVASASSPWRRMRRRSSEGER